MQIQKTNYTPSFSAKFANNQAMREVVQYADKNGCLRTLDCALNTLKKANGGTISVLHGKTADGNMFSTFMCGKRAIPNQINDAKTPAEASFNGIINLSMLTKNFKSLMGVREIEQNITPQNIMKEFTVQ